MLNSVSLYHTKMPVKLNWIPLANQTEDIALDLNGHIDYDSNIRNIYDLTPITADEREVGVGGPLEGYASQFEGQPDPRLERLDKLGRQLMLQDSSYTKVSKVADMQRYIWQHTPSIKPTFGHIVSGFGYRHDPIFGGVQFHQGLDICPHDGHRNTHIRPRRWNCQGCRCKNRLWIYSLHRSWLWF